MNRELKFRVWYKEDKKFSYSDEYYSDNYDGKNDWNLKLCCFFEFVENRPVEQFIGLKDKNGREIYEGDIVNFTLLGHPHIIESEDITNAEVVWDNENSCFAFKENGCLDIYSFCFGDSIDKNSIEIVGNIFQNSELIEK